MADVEIFGRPPIVLVSGQNRARTQGKRIGRPFTFNEGMK
jgi:hypothetical protein